MRVLIINSVCGIRSTGRICTDIAAKYMADGHEVKIAYGRETVPQEFRPIAVPIGSKTGTYVNALKARLLDNEGFNAKKSTKAFLKWAEDYDPDLLWLHNLHGYYINLEMLFSWIKSRPRMEVKWTLHDCWAFTGHCAHFAFVGCDRWQTGCHDCPQTKEYPAAYISSCKENYRKKQELFLGVKKMTLITPSRWLAGLVGQSFLKDYPVEVRYNTIDRAVFKPTEGDFRGKYGLQGKKVILGVASTWSERKGLSDFIKLAGRLPEAYRIVLVGVTEAQKRLLPENVLGIIRTENPGELAQIYTAADVFVNLTYEDTYPTVNLEAQACGTPVITYRTGGSVESVPPAQIVDAGDMDGLVQMILRIAEHRETAELFHTEPVNHEQMSVKL